MVSARAKGTMAEREYERILWGQGFKTQRVRGSSKWGRNVDFFSEYCKGFDIIAFNDSGWLLVQVKSGYPTTQKLLTDMRKFQKFLPNNTMQILAIRRSKDKWQTINITRDNARS